MPGVWRFSNSCESGAMRCVCGACACVRVCCLSGWLAVCLCLCLCLCLCRSSVSASARGCACTGAYLCRGAQLARERRTAGRMGAGGPGSEGMPKMCSCLRRALMQAAKQGQKRCWRLLACGRFGASCLTLQGVLPRASSALTARERQSITPIIPSTERNGDTSSARFH